jgi:hypothetical protein
MPYDTILKSLNEAVDNSRARFAFRTNNEQVSLSHVYASLEKDAEWQKGIAGKSVPSDEVIKSYIVEASLAACAEKSKNLFS